MIVPETVRAVLVGRLSSRHKHALPAMLETGQVYRPVDPSLGGQHPALRVPAGADACPADAFTSDLGRASYRAEPGRFRRARLEAVRAALARGLAQPGDAAPRADRRPA